MARKLTVKQKKLLTVAFNDYGIINVDDLNLNQYNEIYCLNEYETFWSDANRFLRDLSVLPKFVVKSFIK